MRTQYLSDDKLESIHKNLNLNEDVDFYEYVEDAISEFESKLSERYKIPLEGLGVTFASAPQHSRTLVARAIKLLISKVAAVENLRNMGEGDGMAYLNIKSKRAAEVIELLLNDKINYHFKLSPNASSYNPVQSISVARSDNTYSTDY